MKVMSSGVWSSGSDRVGIAHGNRNPTIAEGRQLWATRPVSPNDQRRSLKFLLSKREIHAADVLVTVLASGVTRESSRTEPGVEAIKLYRANLNAVG